MNRGSQRILILGGFAVAVIIIALLAVIVLLLMGGDDNGSSEAARVTATATSSPTPRATATSTAAPSTPGPAGQQAAAVTTTAQQTPPPGAPQQTAAPSGQQPSSTAPPSAPPAATAAACPGPPAVAFFTANPATITAGQSSTLDWGAVTNATSVTVDQGIGAVQAPGARVVSPGTTTIYTLTVTGCGGTIERQATVIVNPPTPSPSPTPTPTEQPPPPGGGSWGITPIDLAVTGLNPDNLPQGKVWVTIVNNGPYALTNAQVTLGCSGTAWAAGGGGTVAIITIPWTISVSLDVGWLAQYDTTISVDTNQFSSTFLECSIEAVSFKDDITGNNSNSVWIP